MMDRTTTSMKEGWLYRTSYDDTAHMMITRWDPDRAMIQIQLWWLWEIQIKWWSRSSNDDLDWVMIHTQWWCLMMIKIQRWCHMMIQIQWWCPMMIQIERWSRFDDLKMKITWRLKKTRDADDEMIQLIQRRKPMPKIVSKEYLPS